MRILRLDFGSDIGSVDLHPFVSVLQGFPSTHVEAVLDAVQSIVGSDGTGVEGLVEHDGQLIELSDGASLGPLTTEHVVIDVAALAVGDGEDGVKALQHELDELRRTAAIDAVYVEEIRADLQPAAAARVQVLRDALDQLENGVDSVMVGKISRLRQALDDLAEIPVLNREIPEDVAELIEEWELYAASRDEKQAHIDPLRVAITDADNALARAQADLLEARETAVPLMLTTAEEERLEELAEGAIDKMSKRNKSIGPKEEAEIQDLLAKVGVPTYTAYAMYRLNPTPAPEKMAELELAEERVKASQTALDEARAALEIDPVAAELGNELDSVKATAREHLGPMLPSDLGAALGKLVVETENTAYLIALSDIYDLASSESVPFPDNLDQSQIPDVINNWIDIQEAQLAQGSTLDEGQIRRDLAQAEAELDRHARAMGRIDQLEAKAAESAARVRELEGKKHTIASGENESGRGMLAGILPVIERLNRENGGSVPLVLQGDFDQIPDSTLVDMMDELETVAQHHQLILVTGNETVSAWATGVGLRRALVARADGVSTGA